MAEQTILVYHNVEMGHRLSLQPDSKCFQLHGHSWQVELALTGSVDSKGMVLGLDFGHIKKMWRSYLDEQYDHHLCLNENDPLLYLIDPDDKTAVGDDVDLCAKWGIVTIPWDPTVENMARIWGTWAAKTFSCKIDIKIHEAATNAATWRSA